MSEDPVASVAQNYDPHFLYLESINLIGSTTISSLFYGIALVLYCLCAHFLYCSQSRNPSYRKHILFTFTHASALMVLATIFLALTTRAIEISYVFHKYYPGGGPFEYQEEVLDSQPIAFLSNAASFLIGILTLETLNPNGQALGVLSAVIWSLPVTPVSQSTGSAISLSDYALGSATTICVTFLVSVRLMMVRRHHIKLLGKPNRSHLCFSTKKLNHRNKGVSEVTRNYMNIVAILVESYALETAWSITTTILVAANNNPMNMLFTQNENYVRVSKVFDSLECTQALNDPSIIGSSDALARNSILHLLIKLAKRRQLFPRRLFLTDMQFARANKEFVDGPGSFAYIYKTDYKGKKVCVKVVRLHGEDIKKKKHLRAAAKEIILLAHVSHANVVCLHGITTEVKEKTAKFCPVLPWMDNGDLSNYLKEFPGSPRIALIHDIVSGLEYLHNQNIVHGDLKPTNVLVSNQGRAILTDFGISHVHETDLSSTKDNSEAYRWMAPEMVSSQKPTPESDIWSLGCTCYEALTGKRPFPDLGQANNVIEALLKAPVIPGEVGQTELKGWPENQQERVNSILSQIASHGAPKVLTQNDDLSFPVPPTNELVPPNKSISPVSSAGSSGPSSPVSGPYTLTVVANQSFTEKHAGMGLPIPNQRQGELEIPNDMQPYQG
ncbi:Serine/threonine-protein kinase sepA [Leucoagaricus sp. SymC.cos]|nr:Serine/threonine-protein kinase sepA [Leucoagaricus sp. SymC.cos]